MHWGLIFISFIQISCAHQAVEESNKIGVSEYSQKEIFDRDEQMRIVDILSNTRLKVVTPVKKIFVEEKLALVSKDENIGIYGISVVKKINSRADGDLEAELEIVSLSKKHTVQVGDHAVRLDLSREQENYFGNTDHMIAKSSGSVSSRYKALVTQGLSIGDTAETLWKNEFLFTYYGKMEYGVYDFLTLGTIVPLNAVGSANGMVKMRFYRTSSNIASAGLSYTKIPNSDSATFNINFMWDSISNDDLVTHNFISLAVVTFDKAEDVTAIKSLGTSSLQTGYEFIMNNWSRILVGPNFNFEKKSVGGYFSYLKIWDRTHLQFSINSTNIRSFKLSPTDGYYAFFDAYWRY